MDPLALPTPSFPNATPSDPTPLPESTNHADDATDNTHPYVWICRKWYTLTLGPPPPILMVNCTMTKNFAKKVARKLENNIFGMCTKNPTKAGKPRSTSSKDDLIFKRVFCNYL